MGIERGGGRAAYCRHEQHARGGGGGRRAGCCESDRRRRFGRCWRQLLVHSMDSSCDAGCAVADAPRPVSSDDCRIERTSLGRDRGLGRLGFYRCTGRRFGFLRRSAGSVRPWSWLRQCTSGLRRDRMGDGHALGMQAVGVAATGDVDKLTEPVAAPFAHANHLASRSGAFTREPMHRMVTRCWQR